MLLIETYFLLKLTKKLEKTRIVEPFFTYFAINIKCISLILRLVIFKLIHVANQKLKLRQLKTTNEIQNFKK